MSPGVRAGWLNLAFHLKACSHRAISYARMHRLDGAPRVALYWLDKAAETRLAAASALAKARSQS